MAESIDITDLTAPAASPGDDIRRARALRAEFVASDPDEVARTANGRGERLTITSSGHPLTVRQVQAELDILMRGE